MKHGELEELGFIIHPVQLLSDVCMRQQVMVMTVGYVLVFWPCRRPWICPLSFNDIQPSLRESHTFLHVCEFLFFRVLTSDGSGPRLFGERQLAEVKAFLP